MNIREATAADAAQLQRIYAPYVEHTAITFEYDAPDAEAFARRIEQTRQTYPYLVAEQDGVIVGYAYAAPLKTREAYRYAAEASVYLDAAQTGRGVGTLLYEALERVLVRQNVCLLYACITEPRFENDPYVTDGSIRFHTAMGYAAVGRFPRCGYKFGAWYSVVWMAKELMPRPETPPPFVPFAALIRPLPL
ncbi:MAG: N-acetyltransferase [Clostridia bacterium]|nr:N-acetyltransferase [Clostridia bacterium]